MKIKKYLLYIFKVNVRRDENARQAQACQWKAKDGDCDFACIQPEDFYTGTVGEEKIWTMKKYTFFGEHWYSAIKKQSYYSNGAK